VCCGGGWGGGGGEFVKLLGLGEETGVSVVNGRGGKKGDHWGTWTNRPAGLGGRCADIGSLARLVGAGGCWGSGVSVRLKGNFTGGRCEGSNWVTLWTGRQGEGGTTLGFCGDPGRLDQLREPGGQEVVCSVGGLGEQGAGGEKRL